MKGTYILVIFLKENSKIEIGSLGKISFSKGYYLYVGSAMGNYGSATLINRVKRHKRMCGYTLVYGWPLFKKAKRFFK